MVQELADPFMVHSHEFPKAFLRRKKGPEPGGEHRGVSHDRLDYFSMSDSPWRHPGRILQSLLCRRPGKYIERNFTMDSGDITEVFLKQGLVTFHAMTFKRGQCS
jgi:hypothetical protein